MKEAARKQGSNRKQDEVQAESRPEDIEVASTSLIAGIYARRYGAEPEAQTGSGSGGEEETAEGRLKR